MPPGGPLNSDSDLESIISYQDAPKRRRSSTGPKYTCGIEGCGLSFKRLDQLDRHEYHHTGIKKHPCPYEGCDKVYSIVTHLKRHLRKTHERVAPPQKTVSCRMPNCDKLFQSEFNMLRHIRNVHENPKVYWCSFCSEKFTQKLKMRRHEIIKHTGNYPYKCEKCDRGFYHQWEQERHVGSCKVYPCSNCELQFDKWSLYIKHCREKNHGRKYYKCEQCERAYSKPSDLKKHVAAKHMNEDVQMTYKCTHDGCDRRYAYERNLKQHMNVAHGGKRFECTEDGCDRVFSSGQNLAKHLERDHREDAENAGNAEKPKTSSKPKPKAKTAKSQRKRRKDAGQSIISNLAKLAGVAVTKEFDKQLRMRQEDALNTATKILARTETCGVNSTDDDASHAAESNSSTHEACEVAESNDCDGSVERQTKVRKIVQPTRKKSDECKEAKLMECEETLTTPTTSCKSDLTICEESAEVNQEIDFNKGVAPAATVRVSSSPSRAESEDAEFESLVAAALADV